MKNILFISVTAWAFAACHSGNNASNINNNPNTKDSSVSIGKLSSFICPGDSLNLSNTVVSPSIAATYTASAQNNVLITTNPNSGGITLPLPGQFQIPFSITDSINKGARLLQKPTGHFISAVEILFGLSVAPHNVYTHMLFFKPLIIPGTVVGGVGTYTCTTYDTNGFYALNNATGTFSRATFSTVAKDTSNFRKYSWYVPCPNAAWQPFNSIPNMNGSTRYVIYPIQELAAMYGTQTSGTINIEYICRPYDASDSVKLDVMLNLGTPSMQTNTNDDLAHLVPPAAVMTYPVVPRNNNN